ncbi:hypothetical protein AXF42_Ash020769 [Apostasia shenzhenica]|uniref:Uncharacterized protein n=1 Tax=Apostasia shenzhenica TaxID=1088818 RepID=A0A2I0APS4_9ASPA|nr:hypothetical protein AXF42_Ash020769 [Apostasia shenzhenica]
MAPIILSQTLARSLLTAGRLFSGSGSGGAARPPPLSRIVSARPLSSGPDAGQLVEVDLGSAADSRNIEVEILSLWKLRDAIRGFVIQKSAPGWLPFVPGASYWMPPVPQDLGSLEIFDRPED